jgi:hypothetical protein
VAGLWEEKRLALARKKNPSGFHAADGDVEDGGKRTPPGVP